MMVYRKVTEEMKVKMKELRSTGSTLVAIGKEFGVAGSTVAYHTDEKQKEKNKIRSIRNAKPLDKEQRERRKRYNRKYQSRRYKNDPEYRERIRKDNRENQKKKYREKKTE